MSDSSTYDLTLSSSWGIYIDPNPPPDTLAEVQVPLGKFQNLSRFGELWNHVPELLNRVPPIYNIRVAKPGCNTALGVQYHIPLGRSTPVGAYGQWTKLVANAIGGQLPGVAAVVLSGRKYGKTILSGIFYV